VTQRSTLNYEETTTFLSELHMLIVGGSTSAEALTLLQQTAVDINQQRLLQRMLSHWEKTHSLATTLQAELGELESFNHQLIQQAEQDNSLEKTLENIINYREMREGCVIESTQRLNIVLSYYLVLAVVIFIFIIFIGNFVLPTFYDLFNGFGADLPFFTRFVFTLTEPVALIIIGVLLAGFIYISIRESSRATLFRLFPLTRGLYRQINVIETLNTIAFLLKQGHNLSDALQQASALTSFSQYQQKMQQASQQVSEHHGIAVLKGFYPPIVVQALSLGANSSGLPALLQRVAQLELQQLQRRVPLVSRLLILLLSLFFGGIILMVLLSIYMPIFMMGSVI